VSEPGGLEPVNPYAPPEAVASSSPAGELPDDAKVRELFERGKNGAAWFYWIAGLSLVNTVMVLSEGGLAFALGLNITMIPDSIAADVALKPGGNWAVLVAALVFDAVILGLFVLCGYLSQRRVLPIFALGMVIYLLDGVLGFLLMGFNDLIGIAIHVFALWSMWSGFMAYRELNQLQRRMMMTGAQ
jgi:hypothetical protein